MGSHVSSDGRMCQAIFQGVAHLHQHHQCGENRWGPPTIFKGVEGEDWERLYNTNAELHKAVNFKKLGNNPQGNGIVVDKW